MKIRWFDRLLLILTSLFLLVLALCVGMLALGYGKESFDFWVQVMLYHPINRAILCVIAVVLVLIALRLLLLRGKRAQAPTSVFMQTTDAGTIRITIEALEQIIQRASRGNAQVREVHSRVIPMDNGMSVLLRVMLSADAKARETSTALQVAVKSALEENTGIPVNEVQVIVEAAPVASNLPARVE